MGVVDDVEHADRRLLMLPFSLPTDAPLSIARLLLLLLLLVLARLLNDILLFPNSILTSLYSCHQWLIFFILYYFR